MRNSTRLTARALAAGSLVLAATAGPAMAQDDGEEFTGTLAPMNDSGASGDITVSVDGTTLTVNANVSGVADLVHAQHLHGEIGIAGSCPSGTELDEDGDGFINTVEGVPNYGTVKASLTTAGETSEAYALAVESFPVAEGGGYTYERSFDVSEEVAGGVGDLLFVVHGADLDGSGEYDGDALSALSEDLPLEATIPIACAKLVPAATTPTGGVATGAGGVATGADGSASDPVATGAMAGMLGALVLGGAALVGNRRRANR